jgi:hypothetical protein
VSVIFVNSLKEQQARIEKQQAQIERQLREQIFVIRKLDDTAQQFCPQCGDKSQLASVDEAGAIAIGATARRHKVSIIRQARPRLT